MADFTVSGDGNNLPEDIQRLYDESLQEAEGFVEKLDDVVKTPGGMPQKGAAAAAAELLNNFVVDPNSLSQEDLQKAVASKGTSDKDAKEREKMDARLNKLKFQAIDALLSQALSTTIGTSFYPAITAMRAGREIGKEVTGTELGLGDIRKFVDELLPNTIKETVTSPDLGILRRFLNRNEETLPETKSSSQETQGEPPRRSYEEAVRQLDESGIDYQEPDTSGIQFVESPELKTESVDIFTDPNQTIPTIEVNPPSEDLQPSRPLKDIRGKFMSSRMPEDPQAIPQVQDLEEVTDIFSEKVEGFSEDVVYSADVFSQTFSQGSDGFSSAVKSASTSFDQSVDDFAQFAVDAFSEFGKGSGDGGDGGDDGSDASGADDGMDPEVKALLKTIAQSAGYIGSFAIAYRAISDFANDYGNAVKRDFAYKLDYATNAIGSPEEYQAPKFVLEQGAAVADAFQSIVEFNSTAAGMAIGALFGGPVGAAIGGIVGDTIGSFAGEMFFGWVDPVVDTLLQIDASIQQLSVELTPYSAELTQVNAESQVRLLEARFAQADQVGGILADNMEARTDFSIALRDLGTELTQLFTPALTKLTELGTHVVQILTFLLDKINLSIDLIGPIARSLTDPIDAAIEIRDILYDWWYGPQTDLGVSNFLNPANPTNLGGQGRFFGFSGGAFQNNLGAGVRGVVI